ncbi:signal peptidase II [Sphingomonas sp.]|jgi:signal peptidase II|uniref:signal peptidase II n=1 Tax=Sphingomonas sp. TaxID=28214 RepID=UPI003D6C8F6F
MKSLRPAGLITAAVVLLVDQLAKFIMTGPLGIDHLGAVREITSFFDLRFVPNFGVSLGLFQADGAMMRWGLVALTAAIAIGVLVWMTREKNRQDQIALGFVLGGAIGNILDRVRLGYVVDFADLHFGEWRPFLVFNVADAAITIGVLVLLVRALLVRDKPKNGQDTGAERAPVENLNA